MTSQLDAAPLLALDFSQAEGFIAALCGSPDATVTFQTFDDDPERKRGHLAQTFWGSLAEAETRSLLEDLNRQGAGIFITINQVNSDNPRLPGGSGCPRQAQHVTGLRALWIDCDGTTPDLSALPQPDITVQSARGNHYYWLLAPNEPLTVFKAAQQRLARALGTDVTINDLCRVMRLPGTWHLKGEPQMVQMLQAIPADARGPGRTIAEILAYLPAPPAPAPRPAAVDGTASLIPHGDGGPLDLFRRYAACVDTAEGAANGYGGRNRAAFHLACEGLGRLIDPADVHQVVLDYAARAGLPETETESVWRSACSAPRTGHAPEILPGGRVNVPAGGVGMLPQTAAKTMATPAAGPGAVTMLHVSQSVTLAPVAATEPGAPVSLAEGRFLYTPTGAADRFAATFTDHMLHADGEGWLVWDNVRWEASNKKAHHHSHLFAKAVLFEARQTAKEAEKLEAEAQTYKMSTQHILGPDRLPIDAKFAEMKQQAEQVARRFKPAMKLAESLNSGSGPATLLKAAESQPAFFCRARDLDADPMLLCVQNGILDLRMRMLLPHDPARRITKLAPVAFDPAAQCPLWLAFIDSITCGRSDLARYLQRALGYSLTGSTREQVFFLCIGGGANGKSTMLEVVKAVAGEYASTVDHTTVLDQNRAAAGPSPDLARLRGARFTTINEIPADKRIDINRIKDMTGGDTIVARHPYGLPFEFNPEFKLWIRANTKPRFRETDEGTWRRVQLIPFDARFSREQRDQNLKDKLLEELPGILGWLTFGALDWWMNGLGSCDAIDQATGNYRDALDTLKHFIEECLEVVPEWSTSTTDLFSAYKGWSEKAGIKPMDISRLNPALEDRGLIKQRFGNARKWYWQNLKIRT